MSTELEFTRRGRYRHILGESPGSHGDPAGGEVAMPQRCFRSPKGVFITSAVAILLLMDAIPVEAHSTQIYVSTPFSPPREYLLIPLLFFALHLCWFHFVSKKAGDLVLKRFFVVFTLANVLPWFCGKSIASVSTAPLPGFGIPFPAFYGYDFQEVGLIFLVFNVVALTLSLPFWVLATKGFPKARSHWRLIHLGGVIAIYSFFLLPYAATGAWTHGWHGGYVISSCENNLNSIKTHLAVWAHRKNMLPIAGSIEELYQTLDQQPKEKSIPSDRRMSRRLFVCPIERSFGSNLVSYYWNEKLAGMSISELNDLDPFTPVLRCRSDHRGAKKTITVQDLLEEIEEIRTVEESS